MQFTSITAVLFLTAGLGMAGPLPAAGNDLATRGENKLTLNAPTMNKKRTFWLPWLHHHHYDFDDDDDDDHRCGGFYTWWGGAGGCEDDDDDDDFYKKGK